MIPRIVVIQSKSEDSLLIAARPDRSGRCRLDRAMRSDNRRKKRNTPDSACGSRSRARQKPAAAAPCRLPPDDFAVRQQLIDRDAGFVHRCAEIKTGGLRGGGGDGCCAAARAAVQIGIIPLEHQRFNRFPEQFGGRFVDDAGLAGEIVLEAERKEEQVMMQPFVGERLTANGSNWFPGSSPGRARSRRAARSATRR